MPPINKNDPISINRCANGFMVTRADYKANLIGDHDIMVFNNLNGDHSLISFLIIHFGEEKSVEKVVQGMEETITNYFRGTPIKQTNL